MKTVNDKFEVCTDCLMYLANGEIGEDTDNKLEDIEKEYKKLKDDEYDVFIGDDEEGSFSTFPCHLCGSHLGGQRFDTNLVDLKEEVVESNKKLGSKDLTDYSQPFN